MDQKQRDKTAWVLAIVLVPVLIYLLVANIAKVRKKIPPPAPPPAAAITAPGGAPGATIAPAAVNPAGIPIALSAAGSDAGKPLAQFDPKILAEQKKIAVLLPANNPFNPARSASVEPPPAAAAPAAPAPRKPPAADLRLTAIMARGGRPTAMINGRLLGAGDRIANWTIIKVTEREVLLKDGARQMVLRLK